MTALSSKSADLLFYLNDLYPQLESFVCNKQRDIGVTAMRDLGIVLYKMSLLEDIPNIVTQGFRDYLYRSARILEASSNVVDHIGKNRELQDCFTSEDFMGDFIRLGAATIYDLAEAMGALGFFVEAKKTRQYAQFVDSMGDTMEGLEEFRIPGDCSPGGLEEFRIPGDCSP